jgi:hypothetical protein
MARTTGFRRRLGRPGWLAVWTVMFGLAAAWSGPWLILRCLPRRYTPRFGGLLYSDLHSVQVEFHGETTFTCWAWAWAKHRPGVGDGEVLIAAWPSGQKTLASTIPSLAVNAADPGDSPAPRRLAVNTLLDAMRELGMDDAAPDVRELASKTFDLLDRYARGTLSPTRIVPQSLANHTNVSGKSVFGYYQFNADASTPVPGMVLLVVIPLFGLWAGGVAVVLRCTRHLVFGPPPTPRPR